VPETLSDITNLTYK